jgi:hypothetical protein
MHTNYKKSYACITNKNLENPEKQNNPLSKSMEKRVFRIN